MVRAVLLDVDGTLIASNDAQAQSWVDAFTEAGIVADPAAIRRSIGMGGDRLLKSIANLDDEEEPGKTISLRRREFMLAKYRPNVRPTRGARAFVEWLRACDVRIVIATAATAEELEPLLKIVGIEGLIDVRVTSDDAEQSKPAPDIVLAALEKSGTRAEDAVMLGDTPYDVAAATAASVTPIAVRCGGWSAADLAPAPSFEDPQDLLERCGDSPLRSLKPVSKR